jgi:hypothetical protein
LPAKSMNLVEVSSAWRERRLISHFPNDFRALNNERVPGNCFVPSYGFGFPHWPVFVLVLLSPLWAWAVLSLLTLRYIRMFSPFCARSLLSDFYESFFCAFHRWRFLSVFLSLALFLCSRTLCLSGTSFVSFLFAFVVVLVHLIPSLQSLCFSVHLPGLFILSAKKITFHCFALLGLCGIQMDRPHKIWN